MIMIYEIYVVIYFLEYNKIINKFKEFWIDLIKLYKCEFYNLFCFFFWLGG